jgi:hypothetical protein
MKKIIYTSTNIRYMLYFLPIPFEIIDIILEFYNIYKVEHKTRFKDTLNLIDSYPTFNRQFKQRVRRGSEIYYQFDYEGHNFYVIKKSSYLETVQSIFNISETNF